MAKQSTRHKWEREGHLYHHTKVCVKCGCIKDSKSISRTIYKLDGQITETAPPCDNRNIQNNNQ